MVVADYLIDSSIESYDTKKILYSAIVKLMPKKILASTTSSLDLLKLSEFYDKEYFVGVHFFNPPTKMKLIEVTYLSSTSQFSVDYTRKFLQKLDDKRVIELPVIQGYIVNRLLFLYMNAAFKMTDQYSIEPMDIDDAMKTGTNMPMGPFELSDYIGNDITYEILKEFHKAFNDNNYEPSNTLLKLIDKKALGRKTGNGFYNYKS